ncbi:MULTISPECIES: hypothetical protein [Pumilibacter]|uniref:hypothetical protein n=1 Tax=Pumilibacter TaxID=2941493 RepID=UPI00203AAC0E|nr:MULTISPECIES: hypothetical protein [Pumilibacter]
MQKGYRIISVEAADIYKHEQENGVAVGYKLPDIKSDAYFWLFKNKLDYSLDSIELEKVYTRICRKKFAFVDEHNNSYTLAVVNVKFNYTYKPENGKPIKVKQLRKYFYTNGFNVNGIHYVRYKRSAGSSREGTCLFIDERLYKHMTKWSECGLKPKSDLASWESYRALSLSSIKGIINIPLNGILFVPDYKSIFTDEVVSVEMQDGKLTAQTKQTQICNDIWDGESLLDESLFVGNYADKHMLLLRNKFFKSCAFKTKLQKWMRVKNITLADLKARGFITLAMDISQIVMVTTPNSLKYLKFVGALNEKNFRQWAESVNSTFGVVKWDKRTRYFGGRLVQSSYQLLNTLGLNEQQAEQLLQPSINYISLIRKDIDFMRYHFTDAFAREKDEESENLNGLAERADVIFTLMHKCPHFDETELYANFRDDVVGSLKERLRRGHILLNGTNATLFGNGAELLKYIAGEEITSELKHGQIRCERFENGTKLLCARSPHITMGNIYLVENNLDGDIWNYFDLGENIVCVNAINENIQQRLNGCDYDSDTMLITDDKLLVEAAEKYNDFFKVPVCSIASVGEASNALSELDHKTSENKIGEIVNLSQKLNSLIWDKLNNGASVPDILPIYEDVCKLAVLSGLEIDKAKRAYDNVNVGTELNALRKKYNDPAPIFFREIDENAKDKQYAFYNTAMDYIYKLVNKVQFRKGREQFNLTIPISMSLSYNIASGNATEYRHKDRIVEIIDEYKASINQLYMALRSADEHEREVIYERIFNEKTERDKQVSKWLTNENVFILVLRHYEKNSASDWHIYAALINHPMFSDLLTELYDRFIIKVVEDPNGEYSLYGQKFAKKF